MYYIVQDIRVDTNVSLESGAKKFQIDLDWIR